MLTGKLTSIWRRGAVNGVFWFGISDNAKIDHAIKQAHI
jgi:hypothetical protein